MNHYNSSSRCPKCGSSRVNEQYLEPHEYHRRRYISKGIIERRCLRCCHVWDELPLDAKEDA